MTQPWNGLRYQGSIPLCESRWGTGLSSPSVLFYFPTHCLGSFLHINIMKLHMLSLHFLPFPRLAPDGTTEQNNLVWCITVSWAHCCLALYSPFHGSIQCSMQRRNGLYKVSKEGQLLHLPCSGNCRRCFLKWRVSTVPWYREFGENEDEKRKLCYWKFCVCAVRWIPGRRFICRLITETISLFLLFIAHSLLLLGKWAKHH